MWWLSGNYIGSDPERRPAHSVFPAASVVHRTAGGEDGGRRADAWSQALDQAQEGMETRPSHDELIANVLADREQVRRNLGELPNEGSRAGVRRRAYRGTMA